MVSRAVQDHARFFCMQRSFQQQGIGQKMSVIPAVYPRLGVIVGYHAVLSVRVAKLLVDVRPLIPVQVEGEVDNGRRRHDVLDQIQNAAHDETVAVLAMTHRYVPRLLNRQAVGVQLGDEQEVTLLIGGVDGPQPVAVHGQVDVGVVIRVQDLFALCHIQQDHTLWCQWGGPTAGLWGATCDPLLSRHVVIRHEDCLGYPISIAHVDCGYNYDSTPILPRGVHSATRHHCTPNCVRVLQRCGLNK